MITRQSLRRWHGDRAPLYSEGLDISRLPYQAGLMTDARWDPDHDTPPFGKETFIRMRYDITAMMISEYARIFPHNVSDENQNKHRALTFSLLYNYGLKMRLDVGKQPTVDNLRWIKRSGYSRRACYGQTRWRKTDERA